MPICAETRENREFSKTWIFSARDNREVKKNGLLALRLIDRERGTGTFYKMKI